MAGFVIKPPQIATSGGVPVMVDGVSTPNAPSAQVAPSYAIGTMLAALNAGSTAYKYVVAIEGCPYLLTDAPTSAAVVAWGGTDWTRGIGGLYVDLDNEQKIDPWNPFQGGGKCTLRVQADANDTFGIDTHRKAAGAEALLQNAAERTTTDLWVDSGTSFATGDAYIGTECVELSSADRAKLVASRRGKYSPFASGGSGGRWFSEHHRIANDVNGVSLNPVVSQQPRTWIGKWVGVWMHKIDGTGALCSKADALCVFAGKIAAVSDDEQTGYTVVELEHVLDVLKESAVGRDMWSGVITEGIFIPSGRTFRIADDVSGAATLTGNDLTVVSSGASGTNQINEGYYSLQEICSFLNAWLGAETAAARIGGQYNWMIDGSGTATRIKCKWRIPNAGTIACVWFLTLPSDVAAFLGLILNNPSRELGFAKQVNQTGITNTPTEYSSTTEPWRVCLFRQDVSGDFKCNVERERGVAQDQYAMFPSVDKPSSTTSGVDASTLRWGIFLINEKILFVASIDVQSHTTTLSNIRPAKLVIPGVDNQWNDLVTGYGHKSEIDTLGPTTIRQVFILETSFATLLKTLFANTGTAGYNGAFDTLGYGLGLGIPGEILGPRFEASLDSLPQGQAAATCIVDEPVKLSDLIGADLVLRRAFPLWKQGGLRFGQWVTPVTDHAVAALDETNKAEPSGSVSTHRAPSTLDDRWVRNVVKIDYDRDLAVSKEGTYQSSMTLEDRTSVDDAGGTAKAFTLKARHARSADGVGLQGLVTNFLATMPLFSRPARRVRRSIDLRYFESIQVGDVVTVTDRFMRDPATGARGVASRPAVVTSHRYNPGGPTPGGPSKVTPPAGEVEVFFLDLHRWAQYAPCADVDGSLSNGGYSAATWTLGTLTHAYSESSEAIDASYFSVGDFVMIVEIDPSSPSSPLSWRRRITAISGSAVSLNQDLLGWDATKRYRMTYDAYQHCGGLQQAKAFFASYSTGKIANFASPYQWATTAEQNGSYTRNAAEAAELVPTGAYGDGVPLDVGHERALIQTLNALIDYKTSHQLTTLDFFEDKQAPGGTRMLAMAITPIFLGLEGLSANVYRLLVVAPLFRNANSGSSPTATVAVTLSRTRPTKAPGTTQGGVGVACTFSDVISRATWTTASTTMVVGVQAALPMYVKNPTSGMAWLTIEVDPYAAFRGLVQCSESPRLTLAAQ